MLALVVIRVWLFASALASTWKCFIFIYTTHNISLLGTSKLQTCYLLLGHCFCYFMIIIVHDLLHRSISSNLAHYRNAPMPCGKMWRQQGLICADGPYFRLRLISPSTVAILVQRKVYIVCLWGLFYLGLITDVILET